VIYYSHKTTFTLAAAAIVLLAGLMIGIAWANNVSRDKGAAHFISRTMATPELDGPETNPEP